MTIYDVSMTIDSLMQVYKNRNEKKPRITTDQDFEQGSTYESRLEMNLHTGTHMDFPLHILKDGADSSALDLEHLIRPVKVFDLTGVDDGIAASDIESLDIRKNDFVLFKTRNSFEEAFNFEFIYLKEDAATTLAEIGVKGVGIDALGIERDQKGHPTHRALLAKGIIIIEGLRLRMVDDGNYFMFALPLKIRGVEALPLSVVLTSI
ncbi:MAG: cyclase family protein [Acholeplasmataceae bacterium]